MIQTRCSWQKECWAKKQSFFCTCTIHFLREETLSSHHGETSTSAHKCLLKIFIQFAHIVTPVINVLMATILDFLCFLALLTMTRWGRNELWIDKLTEYIINSYYSNFNYIIFVYQNIDRLYTLFSNVVQNVKRPSESDEMPKWNICSWISGGGKGVRIHTYTHKTLSTPTNTLINTINNNVLFKPISKMNIWTFY